MVLMLASCEKDEPKQPPCSVTSIRKEQGKITLKMVTHKNFIGTIYVENPLIIGKSKLYLVGTLDTVIVANGITKDSYLIIDYRNGHVIR